MDGPEHDLEQAIDLSKLLTAIFGIQWVDLEQVWFENIGDPNLGEQVPCMTTEPFNVAYSSWEGLLGRPDYSRRDSLEGFIDDHWVADKSEYIHQWSSRANSDELEPTGYADWPSITATVIEGIMWREKMPVGQERAWHRPQILTMNAGLREVPECRLLVNPGTQYEVRFRLGDEAYRQMMFDDTIGWTRFENCTRGEHSQSILIRLTGGDRSI